jgi:hypothetical protein
LHEEIGAEDCLFITPQGGAIVEPDSVMDDFTLECRPAGFPPRNSLP